MSTTYVNGYNNPSFIFHKSDGTFVEEISLPITNEAGLIEDYSPEEVNIKLLNKTKVQKFLGWSLALTLNYDRYVSAATLLKISRIINYCKGATEYGVCRCTIVPRSDNPGRQFRVLHTGDILSIGIHKGGSRASGHKLPVLKFETISLVKSLPITNMDDIPQIVTDFVII